MAKPGEQGINTQFWRSQGAKESIPNPGEARKKANKTQSSRSHEKKELMHYPDEPV
jgi:hypothetical protein